jgi:hypothetical protein
MADPERAIPILIVVGTSLRAEEADRPLAYYLKQQIEERAGEATPARACVVADLRWLHDESFQSLPTISLGGPGVNVLAHRWVEDLPVAMAVDERFYIQMDPELDEPRVSIWGMDNSQTQVAVSAFLTRYLPRYLARCEAVASQVEEADEESEDEDD